MVKHRLVTKQTPPEGVEVQKVGQIDQRKSMRRLFSMNDQVMVAEALDIARETYLAILLDRAYGGAVLMGSPMGGVDIEEVAEKHPDQIYTVGRQLFCSREINVGSIFQSAIDPKLGLKKEQALDMAKKLGFKDKLADEVCSVVLLSKMIDFHFHQAADQIMKLYKLFLKYDCTQIGQTFNLFFRIH